MKHKIVVWCKDINKTIPPCVRDWNQEVPCCDRHCDAIKNYLKDYAL